MDTHPFASPDSTARLTYCFVRPIQSALELAMAGLPTLDGEFVSIRFLRGDSVAEINARVRDETWSGNPEVWAQSPLGVPQAFFGRLHTYLRGDQRFRILVLPVYRAGCEGDRRVIFLRYGDTGSIVGGKDRGQGVA